MTKARLMDLNEFQDKGYLQEINRRFLHPLGLSLRVLVQDRDGRAYGLDVEDARDSEHGIVLPADYCDSDVAREKAGHIAAERARREGPRREALGFYEQPLGAAIPAKARIARVD